MQILDHKQVVAKLKRLAIQIHERNFQEKEIYFAGVNNSGLQLAKLLIKELNSSSEIQSYLVNLKLNPAKPLSDEISIDIDIKKLKNKVIIIVDDVANSGRTLFFGLKPFLEIIPKKLEVAVFVDRTHKTYPIHADYVGLSLATTTKEHIKVELSDLKNLAVHLE